MTNPVLTLAHGQENKGVDLRAFAGDAITEVAMPDDVLFGSTNTSLAVAGWLNFGDRRVIVNRGHNAIGTVTITATSASTGESAMLDVVLEGPPTPPALDHIRFIPDPPPAA